MYIQNDTQTKAEDICVCVSTFEHGLDNWLNVKRKYSHHVIEF